MQIQRQQWVDNRMRLGASQYLYHHWLAGLETLRAIRFRLKTCRGKLDVANDVDPC
jgi:hypothetical protein